MNFRLARVVLTLVLVGLMFSVGCAKTRPRAKPGVYTPTEASRVYTAPSSVSTNALVRPTLTPPRLEMPVTKPGTATTVAAAPAAGAVTTGTAVRLPSATRDVLDQPRAYTLRPGDPVIIYLRGILPKDDMIEDVIDDGGYVKLPYLDNVLAAGKTSSQVENEIQRLYIDRQIYKNISVNVVMPSQSYFVRGEVRNAGRFPIVTGITLLQAIASAGGFTEFADRTDITITRGAKNIRCNAKQIERHPERDIRIETGDVVVVGRSVW